jgi:hypothetical protein
MAGYECGHVAPTRRLRAVRPATVSTARSARDQVLLHGIEVVTVAQKLPRRRHPAERTTLNSY